MIKKLFGDISQMLQISKFCKVNINNQMNMQLQSPKLPNLEEISEVVSKEE